MTSTPIGSSVKPVLAQHGRDLAGDLLGDAGVRVERAAQRGDAGPRAGSSVARRFGDLAVVGLAVVVEPRVVQLVVPGGRAEVPDDRLAAAGQQREPDQLVHRPGADVGGGHVADVGEVEGQQGTELGSIEVLSEALQPIGAEPVEVDPLLPVDCVRPVRADRHGSTQRRRWCSI